MACDFSPTVYVMMTSTTVLRCTARRRGWPITARYKKPQRQRTYIEDHQTRSSSHTSCRRLCWVVVRETQSTIKHEDDLHSRRTSTVCLRWAAAGLQRC